MPTSDAEYAFTLATNEARDMAIDSKAEIKSVVTEPFYGPDEMEG